MHEWLLAAARLKPIDPRARFIATDPLIYVAHRGANAATALHETEGAFEVFDLLLGQTLADIGSAGSVDVIGLNFYLHNPWYVEDRTAVGFCVTRHPRCGSPVPREF
ncbi:MAG: hypothetical protein ACO1Q7_01000 [Gemmatimonas sp.]